MIKNRLCKRRLLSTWDGPHLTGMPAGIRNLYGKAA
jgi:hypothetical protein